MICVIQSTATTPTIATLSQYPKELLHADEGIGHSQSDKQYYKGLQVERH